MLMNKHTLPRLVLIVALLAAFAPLVLTGAENDQADQTPAVQVPQEQQQAPVGTDTDNGDPQTSGQPTSGQTPPAGVKSPSLKTFNPTEKIQADSAVAFPVDI
jgi:hypothetical protein